MNWSKRLQNCLNKKGKIAMKMTNYTLVNLVNALEPYRNKKLPQKISYAITRNVMLATREYQIYEAQLNKIMEEYSDKMIKGKDGKLIVNEVGIPEVEEAVKQEYLNAIADLLNIEIDVEIYTIDESAFDYEDGNKYDVLSPNEIIKLQSILCITGDSSAKCD